MNVERPQTEHVNPDDSRVEEILGNFKNVAIIGLTPDQNGTSHRVARFLKRHGFRVYPVNPRYASVLGEVSYPFLREVPAAVDIVNIFRRPEHLAGIIEDAVSVGAKVAWLQPGIISEDFAARAREAGLEVIMDRCIKKEYERLTLQRRPDPPDG